MLLLIFSCQIHVHVLPNTYSVIIGYFQIFILSQFCIMNRAYGYLLYCQILILSNTNTVMHVYHIHIWSHKDTVTHTLSHVSSIRYRQYQVPLLQNSNSTNTSLVVQTLILYQQIPLHLYTLWYSSITYLYFHTPEASDTLYCKIPILPNYIGILIVWY